MIRLRKGLASPFGVAASILWGVGAFVGLVVIGLAGPALAMSAVGLPFSSENVRRYWVDFAWANARLLAVIGVVLVVATLCRVVKRALDPDDRVLPLPESKSTVY